MKDIVHNRYIILIFNSKKTINIFLSLFFLFFAPLVSKAQNKCAFASFDSITVSYTLPFTTYARIYYCKDSARITATSFFSRFEDEKIMLFDDTTTARFLQLLENSVFIRQPIIRYKNMIVTDCEYIKVYCYKNGRIKKEQVLNYGLGELSKEYKPFDEWLNDLINNLFPSIDK